MGVFKNIFKDYYKTNSAHLLNTCVELITKYEKCGNTLAPTCTDDLMSLISSRVEKSKEEIAGWKDRKVDYIKIAHTMISHGAFDLLTSGRYHIYIGFLDPLCCADNLLSVYQEAMKWAVGYGIITEDQRIEQYNYLLECISNAG